MRMRNETKRNNTEARDWVGFHSLLPASYFLTFLFFFFYIYLLNEPFTYIYIYIYIYTYKFNIVERRIDR